MRQALHVAIGLAFWALLAVLWAVLALEGKASSAAFADTGLQLAALMGAVLAITLWWIRHNVGIYRRKGPRRAQAELRPRTDEDRLGHAVRWAFADGVPAAATEQDLVVELDGTVKTYRRAG
jgi:fatty acid desaturase